MSSTEKGKESATCSSFLPAALGPLAFLPRLLTLSVPWFFLNLYTEHIKQNAGLDELQARIKIAGRNINNLRYTDDTITLTAESEEEQKSLLIRVKEERVKKPA